MKREPSSTRAAALLSQPDSFAAFAKTAIGGSRKAAQKAAETNRNLLSASVALESS